MKGFLKTHGSVLRYQGLLSQASRSTCRRLKKGVAILCCAGFLCQQVVAIPVFSIQGVKIKLSQPNNTTPIQQFGFDGQLTDNQTQWQFLGKGYRAYSPTLHRFMAQDSMSPFEKGGINGYVFASNNPVMLFDPSGHFSMSTADWIGMGVSVGLGGLLGLATGGLSLPAMAIANGLGNIAIGSVVAIAQNTVGHQSISSIQLLATAGINFGMSVVGDAVGIFARKMLSSPAMDELEQGYLKYYNTATTYEDYAIRYNRTKGRYILSDIRQYESGTDSFTLDSLYDTNEIAEFLSKSDARRFRAAMIHAYNFDKPVVHGITDSADLTPNDDAIFNWHSAGLVRHIQATELINTTVSYNDMTLTGSLMKRVESRRMARLDWATGLINLYRIDFNAALGRATDVNTYKLFMNVQYKANAFPWEMDV